MFSERIADRGTGVRGVTDIRWPMALEEHEAEQSGEELALSIASLAGLRRCPNATIPTVCGCAPGECAETDNAAWRKAMI